MALAEIYFFEPRDQNDKLSHLRNRTVNPQSPNRKRFGFQDLGLNKIYATHFPHNPASGKIMQNCGMKLEATLKQEYFKNGKPLDVLKYSVLKQDFVNLEF